MDIFLKRTVPCEAFLSDMLGMSMFSFPSGLLNSARKQRGGFSFVSEQAVDPFQHLEEACCLRFVWAFSNLSFYLQSSGETRRYQHHIDITVDIISAETPLPALPFPKLFSMIMRGQ